MTHITVMFEKGWGQISLNELETVEIRKTYVLPVARAREAVFYLLQAARGNLPQLRVLSRRDLNFCVRGTPVREWVSRLWKATDTQVSKWCRCR